VHSLAALAMQTDKAIIPAAHCLATLGQQRIILPGLTVIRKWTCRSLPIRSVPRTPGRFEW